MYFNKEQIKIIDEAVLLAEELVSNEYKIPASAWLRHRYDVKTLADLSSQEILDEPYAHVVRYKGQKNKSSLGSTAFDFYKICLQDQNIIPVIDSNALQLFPFSLYIMCHELIHIVRFSRFLQNFNASFDEKLEEEIRVHNKSHEVLSKVNIKGLNSVLEYKAWKTPEQSLKVL